MKKSLAQHISLAGIALCVGFSLGILQPTLTAPLSTGMSERSISRTLAAAIPPPAATGTTACTNAVRTATASSNLFPLVPASFRSTTSGGCNQSLWNIHVFAFFVYRALAILNYIAGTAAIILTFYAGLLYVLGGSGNEAQTKQAKSLLTATYTGLVIVLLARVIVYSSFLVFDDKSLDTKTVDSLVEPR